MVRRRTSARKKRTAYHALGGAPARKNGGWLIILGALVVVNLYVFVWDKKTGVGAIRKQAEAKTVTMTIPAQSLAAPDAQPASVAAPVGPPTTIEGKVGKSDTLGKLLRHNGLTTAETDEVVRALSGILDFRTIRAGQAFKIERGPDGRVQRFELEVSKARHVRAERRSTGELISKADD